MFEDNPGGQRLFIVQLASVILGWIFSLLRAYVKIFMIKKITPDDYLMLMAMVSPPDALRDPEKDTDDGK